MCFVQKANRRTAGGLLRASTERRGGVAGLVLPVVLVVLVELVELVELVGRGAATQTADVSADDLVHCNRNRSRII